MHIVTLRNTDELRPHQIHSPKGCGDNPYRESKVQKLPKKNSIPAGALVEELCPQGGLQERLLYTQRAAINCETP